MYKNQVAVIGCGSIGEIVANSIERGKAGDSRLVGLFDVEEKKAKKLKSSLDSNPKIYQNFKDLLMDDRPNLIVEVASQKAVKSYLLKIIKTGKDCIILSSGALANENFSSSVKKTLSEADSHLYIPSGAIFGLDGVQSAKIAGIERSLIETRKPPKTLSKTNYVEEKNIGLKNLVEEKCIFEGTAREAAKAFPKSINVAATLSLATLGFDDTEVKIIADPEVNNNLHQIRIESKAGELSAKAKNYPSPKNPKTSYLAALSTIMTIKNFSNSIKIGV